MLIELEDNLTHLTLAPAVGASIVNWRVRASGQPLLRHSDQQALDTGLPGKLGCYPLAPWSNRIAQGGFDNPDGWLALAPNSLTDPLPIHGSAWQQAWQVVSQSADEVVLELLCDTPFAYRAEQRFCLRDGELSITLRVTHLADNPAWHGLGLHPYLPRTPQTRLQAKASQVWMSDASKLPMGLAPVPAAWDFQTLKTLPEGLVDNGFCQWDGHCLIEQPELGYTLECQATGADYFLLYCPPGLGFFCIEPVSHPVNAHHLAGRPGLKLLEHNQLVQLNFKLKYIQHVGGGLPPMAVNQ
ncbi:aldose 1-epimerase [Pseudomonas extremorientalis]|uniref:Aldose 1-epimerase n=1 Tax=Pseudomonas extremorientalis TaxID=169669 RepID=A0A1H0LTU5_9PSED|nr:aldose 1-epimerase [Pseudomonas extremorientalis]KAB0520670.1 aldose 1-epimerase [Pseudomonas extremorientalis]OIN04873.1 aldose epimerase [Pseudomonas extremorientalis]UUN86796.1 aldose 1-epimerase [Pseudomonas extremorientalis]SDO71584.1 aldose 1-epimerase [Pseudomonas extremorientalis]